MSRKPKTSVSNASLPSTLKTSTDDSSSRQKASHQLSDSSTENSEIVFDNKDFDHADLLNLYKVHVDEYRYNVSLTWDRTKFLLTLNSTLTVAGLTLFRFASESLEYMFFATIFLLTILTSWLSVRVSEVGKAYYRNARQVLKLAERRIGLHNPKTNAGGLGLATTETMSNPDHAIDRPQEKLSEKGPTITRLLRIIFYVLMTINLTGMAISIGSGYHEWSLTSFDEVESPGSLENDTRSNSEGSH